MQSFREVLDLPLHELCCSSLGSDLLLHDLKLLLNLDVGSWLLSAAALAPGVRSRYLATSCTDFGERV